MPTPLKGQLRKTRLGWSARVEVHEDKHQNFPLARLRHEDEDEARERSVLMHRLAAELRHTGHADEIEKLLNLLARARRGRELETAVGMVRAVCSGAVKKSEGSTVPAFEDFAKEWTSGVLHSKWPDHVKDKRTKGRDKQILETYINPILGPTPLDRITLDDCDRVMSSLPAPKPLEAAQARGRGKGIRRGPKKAPSKRRRTGLSPASRRHVAQVVSKLMALATYPGRHIAASPIPKGWLPKVKQTRAKSPPSPERGRRADGLSRSASTRPSVLRRAGARGYAPIRSGWIAVDRHQSRRGRRSRWTRTRPTIHVLGRWTQGWRAR